MNTYRVKSIHTCILKAIDTFGIHTYITTYIHTYIQIEGVSIVIDTWRHK